MHHIRWALTFACVVFVTSAGSRSASASDQLQGGSKPPRTRTFRLDYGVQLSGLKPGTKVRLWLPEPQTTEDQTVTALPGSFPAKTETHRDRTYGNQMIYLEAVVPTGATLACQTSYRVERREVRGLPGERKSTAMTLTDAERKLHLQANSRIPLTGKSQQLLAGAALPKDPLVLGRFLYDRVDDHVKYDKSRPGFGQGDVEWVCDSRFGNCTDFHSLFIAWARAHGLPARFEIGFPLPESRGQGSIAGYHCWAFFYLDGHGWTPVDISEADKNPALKEYYFGHLTENRVTFTVGRDIQLAPRQTGPPLNFFVFPYAEVDGQPLAADHLQMTVRYADN